MAGVLIPLYSYPGREWTRVVQQKIENPAIPFIAIVNPNNGPGSSADPNYRKGIEQLRGVGIDVAGYVYTNYGMRSSRSILSDISAYMDWYELHGVFLDEMSNRPEKRSYYDTLLTEARAEGCSNLIGNPGSPTLPSYFQMVDNMVIYEGAEVPSSEWLASNARTQGKAKISCIAYDVFPLDVSVLTETSVNVDYLYLTNEKAALAYSSLPIYFELVVSQLGKYSDVRRRSHLNQFISPSALKKLRSVFITNQTRTGEELSLSVCSSELNPFDSSRIF